MRTPQRPARGLVAMQIMLSRFLPHLCITFMCLTAPVTFIKVDNVSYDAD
jgi:hypothetical protein